MDYSAGGEIGNQRFDDDQDAVECIVDQRNNSGEQYEKQQQCVAEFLTRIFAQSNHYSTPKIRKQYSISKSIGPSRVGWNKAVRVVISYIKPMIMFCISNDTGFQVEDLVAAVNPHRQHTCKQQIAKIRQSNNESLCSTTISSLIVFFVAFVVVEMVVAV